MTTVKTTAMHDIRSIRDNPEAFDRGATPPPRPAGRGAGADRDRRKTPRRHPAFEQAQARRNAASKEIGEAKKAKDEARAQALMAEVNALKTDASRRWSGSEGGRGRAGNALATIPNLPLDEVPDGADETGNVEHHTFGAKREYASRPSSISSWARRSA